MPQSLPMWFFIGNVKIIKKNYFSGLFLECFIDSSVVLCLRDGFF